MPNQEAPRRSYRKHLPHETGFRDSRPGTVRGAVSNFANAAQEYFDATGHNINESGSLMAHVSMGLDRSTTRREKIGNLNFGTAAIREILKEIKSDKSHEDTE